MKRTLLCLTLLATLSACSKQSPTVDLDSWWDVDYAKNACDAANAWYDQNAAAVSQLGCSKVTACEGMMPRVDACQFDTTGGVHGFETKLKTAFASNPECQGVGFTQYFGPEHRSSNKSANEATQQPNWWHLQFAFTPGASQQNWSLMHSSRTNAYTEGKGTPEQVAGKVCAIVRHVGAQVRS